MGIPLLRGRYFTSDDEAVPDRVIILSRSFAAKWFPDGALGGVVSFGRDDRRHVVGIVEDVHAGRLSQDSAPQFYVPLTETTLGVPSIYVIRTTRSVESLRADATTIVRELDRRANAVIMSAEDAMTLPLTFQRIANQLTIGFALLALLIAIVNVYALSAFAVVQRTREIGIRVALGATAADTMRLVMRRGLVWVSVGLALGGALTIVVAGPLLEHELFRTRTSDPTFLALSLLAVMTVATIASWLPARRATAIDPAVTLRAE
jgi:putative ABC transport system permease protein